MKVIMLQDVGGVGQKGKVVDVSDGYALNFLIPHKKAEQATPAKEAEAKKRAHDESQKKAEHDAALKAAVQALNGARIEMSARASEKGGLFKQIGTADIAREILSKRGVRIPETAVIMEKPIKETGDHTTVFRIAGAEARVTVVVRAL